jgi:hypothetical protein
MWSWSGLRDGSRRFNPIAFPQNLQNSTALGSGFSAGRCCDISLTAAHRN